MENLNLRAPVLSIFYELSIWNGSSSENTLSKGTGISQSHAGDIGPALV